MKKLKPIFAIILVLLLGMIAYFQYQSSKTISIRSQIDINAAPAKVWSVLNDLEAVDQYNPQISKASCISTNKEGLGAARQCVMKDGSTVKERVIGIVGKKAITIELYESDWPVQNMKWTTAIDSLENHTRVVQELTYQVKMGALGAFLNSVMMESKMTTTINEAFSGLKNYVESKK